MTQPDPIPDQADDGINAILYQGGILRRSWRFKFVGRNGEKFGHQYNEKASARAAVRKLIKPRVPVYLYTQEADGTLTEHGRIR